MSRKQLVHLFRESILAATLLALAAMAFSACAPSEYTLSTSCNPDGGGSVSPTSGTYDKNVEVDVTATPASGYRFDHWEGSASGESPMAHLVMDSNKNLRAYFTKVYTLSASCSPSSGGSVSPSSGTYDEGSEVTLIGNPTQYYKFNGWGGDVSGSSDHITVTMDSDKNIVASFVKLTYTLQTQVDASGGGTIDPGSGTYEAGTHVTIIATPASGYRFNHWGGSASGTSSSIDVFMDTNRNLTAYFTRVYTLTISCSPNGSCTISPTSGVYDAGTIVNLVATAIFPYAFDHWNGTDSDNVNPTTITMDSDKSPVAYFTELTPGAQQQKTGTIYNNASPMPTIPLEAGQWAEVGIWLTGVNPNTSVRILDPYFGVVQDLGVASTFSCSFQAQKTGNYSVSIAANFVYSIGYTVRYTIYS